MIPTTYLQVFVSLPTFGFSAVTICDKDIIKRMLINVSFLDIFVTQCQIWPDQSSYTTTLIIVIQRLLREDKQ